MFSLFVVSETSTTFVWSHNYYLTHSKSVRLEAILRGRGDGFSTLTLLSRRQRMHQMRQREVVLSIILHI